MGKIIIVNGRQYYEATGLPVEDSPATHIRENESSANIHQGVQKSQTLNRRFVKQPKSRTVEQIQQIQQFKRKHDYEEAKKRAEEMNATAARLRVASAPKITRFNPGEGSANRVVTPIKRAPETKPALQEAQPTPHPIQQKIETAKNMESTEKRIPTPKELKINAINQALERAQAEQRAQTKAQKKTRGLNKRAFWQTKKIAGITASFVVAFLSMGYLAYINLPSISTKVAAAQAGIDAALPAYSPSGYELDGLAAFDGKSVNINYKKDGYNFTLKQAQSSWDSVALLNNYINDEWAGEYLTTQEKGLTIYTNKGKAAWVNNGIVYTISGDSNLSNEQIRKIATSL